MALKSFKPVTPSLRQLVVIDRSELWKGKPIKALTEGLRKSGGRVVLKSSSPSMPLAFSVEMNRHVSACSNGMNCSRRS